MAYRLKKEKLHLIENSSNSSSKSIQFPTHSFLLPRHTQKKKHKRKESRRDETIEGKDE